MDEEMEPLAQGEPELTDVGIIGSGNDLMSIRAMAMILLAREIDAVHDKDARAMLTAAMGCLLWTINPPRGQVQEVPRAH